MSRDEPGVPFTLVLNGWDVPLPAVDALVAGGALDVFEKGWAGAFGPRTGRIGGPLGGSILGRRREWSSRAASSRSLGLGCGLG